MESKLVSANVVVAAGQFNPTIFDQIWLLKNGIAAPEDFKGGESFILTPPFVQFHAPQYVLLVMPEQLQFVPQPITEESGKLIIEKVGTIVRLLPQTPYIAIGLNFVWHLMPEQTDYLEFCKALFFRNNPLYGAFNTNDTRFGGYLSRDVLGTRLKLDIKPVKVSTSENDIRENLQLVFNYNVDLDRSNAAEQIVQTLEQWDKAKDYARGIVANLENWKWK